MLVVFKQQPSKARVNVKETPDWSVRYCVASPTFRTRFFEKLTGCVPADIAATVTERWRDLANSCVREMTIASLSQGNAISLRAEFFSNTYSIFCLLTPATSRQP
jgi:hypothetical protein